MTTVHLCLTLGLCVAVGQLSQNMAPTPGAENTSSHTVDSPTTDSAHAISPEPSSTNDDASTTFTNYYSDPLLAPPRKPKILSLTISPGTVREGVNYGLPANTMVKDEATPPSLSTLIKAQVTLTAPATEDFSCHLISMDREKVSCKDIDFTKGSLEGTGILNVNWDKIQHDCRVEIKAYDPDEPLNSLWFTVSLRKSRS
jgi:hypothetical protein